MAKRGRKRKDLTEPLFTGYAKAAALIAAAAIKPPLNPESTPIPDVRASTAVIGAVAAVASEPTRGLRPHAPRAPAQALRCAEVLSYPARLFPALPGPWTLLCEASVRGDNSVLCVVTTCAQDYTTARNSHYVTLHGAELAAVVLAAELGRVTQVEFERWLELKQRDRSWELTPRTTLGAFVHRGAQELLTLGQVLRACGAAVVDVASTAPAPAAFWEAMHGTLTVGADCSGTKPGAAQSARVLPRRADRAARGGAQAR